MEKKSSFLTLALAAALTALPAAAQEEIRVVSSELMDALEAWSTPTASFESFAIEAKPELIEGYVPVAETYHGGRPLAEVFAEQLPQTYAEFKDALGEAGGELDDPSAELLAYAMAGGSQEYARWQSELEDRGAGFQGFVASKFPDVAVEVDRLNVTPADQRIGLLEYVQHNGDPVLIDELRRLWGTIQKKKDCTCWTVVNFPEQPTGWTTEINENYSDSWGWPVKKRQNLNYYVGARGAARDINFWKKSEHNLWEVVRDKSSNLSSMRVRMSCTRNDSTATSCTGPTCSGEFVARIGYSSRVYERHDVGGPWSKEAQALTADHAKLTYDDPSSGPITTLFNKGVAVSGQYQSGWNASAIANILYVAGQVALAVATDGSSAATLLSQDMVNTTVNGIAGLITHSGSPGSRQRDMMVAWDNSVSTPILLLPNQTHLFELKANSKIYSRGYGGRSETWGNIDSADYFVGVGRNYQCASNVFPPVARAHWIYGGTGNSPYSTATMQNFVGTFSQTELGVYPPNLATIPGQFP
jgi:hypothetical protein